MNDEEKKQTLAKFQKWLEDGQSWIGVFENKDLSSSARGTRIAMSFWMKQWDQVIIGQTTAPDGSYGLGWRYYLVAKCKTAAEALAELTKNDETQEG